MDSWQIGQRIHHLGSQADSTHVGQISHAAQMVNSMPHLLRSKKHTFWTSGPLNHALSRCGGPIYRLLSFIRFSLSLLCIITDTKIILFKQKERRIKRNDHTALIKQTLEDIIMFRPKRCQKPFTFQVKKMFHLSFTH